ncbi:OmpA family protein [Rudanella paleaurantiibacter]|uniref:OmpA family protein n=1 Tax=Rudanella paleaurantiibacter TaxID=2614655 RepID=A0A7J5U3T5_9BACT|nr:OmpA family protein [Rudanella paleaurantiibacter]KAB7732401.1 OmpA family protein [Rudanella paleaurantiibacter]
MATQLTLRVFTGCLWLLWTSVVNGQNQPRPLATFDGTVVSANTRQPIADARIEAIVLPERTVFSNGRTRPDGTFRLTLDPARTYSIVTRADGYKDLEEKLAFSDQRADRIYGKEIRLEPGSASRPTASMPVVLPTLTFAPRRADLLPEAVRALRLLATQLTANPGVRIEVAGHTDTVGDITLNRILALDRAEAVRAFLVQSGIDPNRVAMKAYGGTRPLPGPLSPQNRARNKRVEITVLPNP